ncbi:flagellar assembly protein FliH [Nocardioides sp. Kera G14]|uniref:FliH/SctL family protein n=1 Tax=Nocardioides sp. Kera G14 TaxID=2884264 RepID=UPI001D12828C|nr:flagellar assembly protein FliH [Nocardioides sp. Kera G14]UDY24068.1 flagellar assembly protein FliH [Nocardioides sp. Kera G14]
MSFDHQVIRRGSGAPLETLTTPDLPRGEIEHTELARTVLGEVAEKARTEARAQGYLVGWSEGRRDAQQTADQLAREHEAARLESEARRTAEHAAAVQALATAAAEVRGLLESLAAAVESQATHLAWSLTETLVGHQLSVLEAPDVVRRVLDVLPAVPTGLVRFHPSVASEPAVRELVDAGLEILGDPRLGPADALVESNGAVTDLRISAAMERVRAVLTDDSGEA